MLRFPFKVSALLLLFCFIFQSYTQAQIYVNSSAAGTANGTSWANAYTDLQKAMIAAVAGNEIWVAKGNYSPGGLIASTFTLKNGVKMYGGFAGTETTVSQRIAAANGMFSVNESVLDGGNTSYHVVSSLVATVTASTVLDGFTIANGRTLSGNSNAANYRGAGIHSQLGSAVFQNLWLHDNYAGSYGGAIFNGGTATYKNLLIENNGFLTVNSGGLGAGIYNSGPASFDHISLINNLSAYSGGGMHNTAVISITDAVFKNNSASSIGGGLNNIGTVTMDRASFTGNTSAGTGGGINSTTALTITQSTFTGNTSATNGGGIFNSGTTSLDRCSFIGNTAVQHGGGSYNYAMTVRNTIFSQNAVTSATAGYYGGGMYIVSGTSVIQNTTFSNNTIAYPHATIDYGGGLYSAPTTTSVYNSVFWGNKRGGDMDDQIGGAKITLASNLIKNNFTGSTNTVIGDPQFEDPVANDLRLKNGSVAINAGDNTTVGTSLDFAGNTRILNAKVDLGALENTTSTGYLSITPATLNTFTRGAAFSQQLSTSSTGTATWSVAFGTLPLGIALNAQTGLLSGVPVKSDAYSFVVKVVQNGQSSSIQYYGTVNDGVARLYVNVSSAGANNGASWSNAFTRLQSAITLAEAGDEIWVAKGVYSPAYVLDSAFTMVSGVKMYGGFAGTQSQPSARTADQSGRFTVNETLLTGNDYNRHVIQNSTLIAAGTLIDGFTITGGNSNGLGAGINVLVAAVNGDFKNLVIRSNRSVSHGAGMCNAAVAISLDNVLFESNTVTSSNYGGGLYNTGANTKINNVAFKGNSAYMGAGLFTNGANVIVNKAVFDSNISASSGGGLYNGGTSFILSNAIFQNNQSATFGGGWNNAGTATVTDAVFKGNKALTYGGGISSTFALTADRVSFINNTAVQSGAGFYTSVASTLSNTVFSRNNITNTASYFGAGMYVGGGVTNIYNATFSNNINPRISATVSYGAGLYRNAGTVNIYNSIFWGNRRGNDLPDQVAGTLNYLGYSTVEGGYATGDNILVGDPLFTDASIDSLTLKTGSLAIDRGNNNEVSGSKDVAGNLRIFNSVVDHGAYESQGGASLKITPAVLPVITRGIPVDIQFAVTGGTAPYTWDILSGTLPFGLSFSSSGRLTGIPMTYLAAGYPVAFSVTDGTLLGTKQFTINVVQAPARIYVRPEATAGKLNGSSWTDAYPDPATALTAATAGDEIWVAKGQYLTGTTAATTFTLKEGVKLYGGFAGTETSIAARVADANTLYTTNETVLSGNGISYHVVTNVAALTNATVVDGFSITAGKSVQSTGATSFGAGIYNSTGSAVFRNLWVKNNIGAYYGGGAYNLGSATFENIRFEKNTALYSAGYGGGLYNEGSGATLKKLTFIQNEAIYGGGFFNAITDATIEDVIFTGNKATTGGGGMNQNVGTLTMKRGVFDGNTSAGMGGAIRNKITLIAEDLVIKNNTAASTGGGIHNLSSITLNRVSFIANVSATFGGGLYTTGTSRLDNVVFSRNRVTTNSVNGFGGGMYHAAGTANLSNVTFSNNTTAYIHATTASGSGYYGAGGTSNIYNSIIWGNSRGNNLTDQIGGTANAVTTIVDGGYAAGTNISIGNPLFTDAVNDNLRIKGGSAAMDAGNNSLTLTTKDLDNKDRVINDVVDLGAYENPGGESLTISPALIPAADRGALISQQFAVTGANGTVTYTVSSGALPAGLTLSTSGLLSGRLVAAPGNATFVISVTDGILLGSKQYTIVSNNLNTHFLVKEAATGKNNGSSWTDALTDLQSGLTQAIAGDEIWVAKGKYSPGLLAASTFTLKEGVKLYGGFAGTENTLAARDTAKVYTDNISTLDGSQGVASYHVVSSTTAVTNATILDGFTISGGSTLTTTSTSTTIVGSTSYSGAGIFLTLGSPVFNNLIITGNSAIFGAGAYITAGSPIFNNVKFIANAGKGALSRGGAMLVAAAATVTLNKAVFDGNVIAANSNTYAAGILNYGVLNIYDAVFKNNSIGISGTAQGGALYNASGAFLKVVRTSFSNNTSLAGGAAYIASTNSEFTDVTFKDNSSAGAGGAVYTTTASVFNRVYFTGNQSVNSGGAIYAGAALKLDNVVFSRNKVTSASTYYGGAIFANAGASTLNNITFSNNTVARTAAGSGGALYKSGGTATINNSIFWGNFRGVNVSDQIGGTVVIDKSIVQDGYATGTNISIGNPLFVNADLDNFKLKAGSPAIDMGNNTVVSTATDINGDSRIIGDIVDLGAFENQGSLSLVVSPLSLPAYNRGDIVSVPLTVSGDYTGLTWSVSSGVLPLGMTLKPGGELIGRPMVSGSYTFVISATNGELVGSRQYSMVVNAKSTVIYTNIAATTGNNDGSSWANGYTDLQMALTKAVTGDEIWVAKGIYSPGLLVTSTFTLKDGVKVYGGFAGTEVTLAARDLKLLYSTNSTVLDGSQGAASRHVVFNNIALSETTSLDGFTVSGGQTLTGNDGDNYRGGGIYNLSLVKAKFNNLHIKNNKADRGAGVYNTGNPATFSNILFENNEAFTYCGGMCDLSSTGALTDIIFKGNTAKIYGGGLVNNSSTITLNRVSFIGNTAGQQGAGMYQTSGTSNLFNVLFSRNAVTTAGTYYGGGMFVAGAANLTNVTFSNNTIAFTNATTFGGAGLYRSSGVLTVNNSIFWGNKRGGGVSDQLNAGITLNQSIVQGGYATGTSVLIGDPLFTSADTDDLQLKGGSPAIDAGNNDLNAQLTDLAGNPRLVNDVIDLGAYESQGGSGLKITPAAFAVFTRGIDPNIQMTATGGTGNYNWSLQSGILPTGLLLTADGILKGMPTVAGKYTFVIAATDGTLVGSKQYTVTVGAGSVHLYVYQTATGNNNGSSWANAFTDLQAAMAQVTTGDEIWVAKGTYSPGTLASSYFTLKEGVKIYGGFAATESLLSERDSLAIRGTNETRLDGGSKSYHVVYNTAALTSATVLDGFTIQNGKAQIINTSNSNANYFGGGIYNTAGAGIFKHLWLKNNIATFGAGLYHSGEAVYSDIIFSNNQAKGYYPRGAGVYNLKGFKLVDGVFEGNLVNDINGTGYGAALFNTGDLNLNRVKFVNNTVLGGQGGAIYSNAGTAFKITNATFTGNKAASGGAMYLLNGNPILSAAVFKDNIATTIGGAIYTSSTLNLNGTSFINNTSAQQGGAIWAASTLVIDNSIFSRNRVTGTSYLGGAIYVSSGNSAITNTSFSNNSIAYVNASATLSYGGALYRNSGVVTAYNNIFWGNTRGNAVPDQLNAGIDAGSSIIQKDYPTGTNIKIGDPMFMDAATDDLRLKAGSLAIDAGDNSKQHYEKDLAGNTRLVNSIIDLGAYENDGTGQLLINPVTISPITRGVFMNLQFTTNSLASISWSFKDGKLPVGMVLTANGLLRGTPTLSGTYTFVIAATDGTLVGNRQYMINVYPGTVRLYVHQTATGDNNGSTWQHAFTELQPAIAQAESGDEIWVAKGLYSSGLTALSSFVLKEGVKMYGGFAGTEAVFAERDTSGIRGLNETILDGGQGVPSYHVVSNSIALTSATVLDGFSIQGGQALTNTAATNLNYYGGGIYNVAGAAVFNHLWIKNNIAKYGGGLFHTGDAVYTNIRFSNNQAQGNIARGAAVYNTKGFRIVGAVFDGNKITEAASVTYGGAIFNTGNSDLTDVKFINNTLANGQGGAIYSASSAVISITDAEFSSNKATTGGALFISNGTLNLNAGIFKQNAAAGAGGAMYISGTANLNRDLFIANTSLQHGAAIWSNATLKIDNSAFSQNKVTTLNYFGGGVYISSGAALLNNTSFSNNKITYINASATLSYGAGLYRNSGTATVHNSVFWGNKRGNDVADQLNAGTTISNSLVQNGYITGTAITIGDPMFEDATTDNLRLKGGSVAIDAGENSWQAYDTDLAGKARIVKSVIDLGAYENEGGPGLIISPVTIANLGRGTHVDLQLITTGGTEAVTWALKGGKLPVGLIITPDGKLRGTPTIIGSYTFVIGASDGTLIGSRQYTVTIDNGTGRLYVHQSATGDNNGSDWANAFTDLQAAMGQSAAGDEIWVAKGTYSPGALATSTFTLKEGVKIYGGFAATEKLLIERDNELIRSTNETILDGGQGTPSFHVVYNAAALTNATVLDGFSIQGGSSTSSAYYVNGNYFGGGIYNSAGAAVFNHLWIKNNLSTYGAGVYHNGNATYTDIIFSNNRSTGTYARGSAVYNVTGFKLSKGVFENNKIIEAASSPGYGGAIFSAGVLTLKDVKFENNTITAGQGGAIYTTGSGVINIENASFTGGRATRGGALYLTSGNSTNLLNVSFKNNMATEMGGALYIGGTVTLNKTSFINNTAVQNGGAIWSIANLQVNNSIFSRNSVTATTAFYGAAVYVYSGTTTINNSSFSNNTINYQKVGALNYGGAIYRNAGALTINNSILWGNKRGGGLPDQINLLAKVNNSLVQGGYPVGGVNIIDADPAFTDAAVDSLSLKGCSAAINTGDNALAAAFTVDYLGKPRLTAAVVDIGAIEYQDPVLTLNPASMPQGNRGEVYNLQLEGTGGATGTYTYKLISGKIPDGLSLTSSGLITGSPIVIGKYSFTLNVSDGNLCGNRTYNVEIVPGTGVVRILVNQAATAGQNNGSTWSNAYLDLQSALKVSLAGDQIWVAKGTYSPGDLITSTYTLKEGVKIYGGFAATENTLAERDTLKTRTDNQTILDGKDLNRHVVYNNALLTNATVLDGFTITRGKTATGTSTGEAYIGAGVFNSRGAAVFNNLWIKNNNASTYGGGMYNNGTSILNKITFESNKVTTMTSSSYRYGGGLYNSGAAVLNNLEFISNSAIAGGGLFQSTAIVVLNNIVFRENNATNGGGLYANNGRINLNNASFIANNSLQHGGGIYQYSSTLTLNNVLFSRNKVTQTNYYGGAFYQYTATSTLVNVTMSNNSISYINNTVNKYGGAIYRNAGTLNLQNSILWGNKRGNNVSDELNLNVKVTNALIQGGYAAGKIVADKDPMFNLTTPDDLSLSDCSPAINIGDNTFSAALSKDLAGLTRVKAEIVDLGAYENQKDRIIVNPATVVIGLRGMKFEQQLSATGGNGNYTYSVGFGKLPDGLLISPQGKITGRPITIGTYTFNIIATDGNLCGNRLYTAEIKAGTGGVRIFVNQAATGMDNGANWENGFLTLQKGLSSSLAGDSIFVAKGSYSPGLLTSSYFTLKQGVKIFGGFAGTENELAERDSTAITGVNETILDGGNKSYHVVYNAAALTNATVLDGFSITNGSKVGSGNVAANYYGAGIYNANGKAVFKNLWVKNNYAVMYGGGIYNTGAAEFTNIILENNTVINNGGGMYNTAITSFKNIKFIGNKASYGAGLFNTSTAVTITNALFNGNASKNYGGGMYQSTGTLTLNGASFIANTAVNHGAGIYKNAGTMNITNAVFSQNKGTSNGSYGGAIYTYTGVTNLINTSISNNSMGYVNPSATTSYGGAIYRYTGTVSIYNSILWGNKRGNGVPDQLNALVTVGNSIVQNGYKTGTMILLTDPQFKNAAADDLSLASCSPAVNMGDNARATGITTDIIGAARIKNTTVDLGAYEFQGTYLENAAQQLPDADQWTPYSHQIVISESGTHAYTLSQGLLPDGMLLSTDGKITGAASVAGDYEFTLAVQGADVCGSLKVKLKVVAKAPYIIEVLKPYPVPVKKDLGTLFEDLKLVTTVEVVMSDNSHAKFPVTWIKGEYDGSVIGIYTLTGMLTVPTPEVNKNNLTAIAKVAVLDPVYPYIVSVAHLDSINVLSGTDFTDLLPLLPKQVMVTYDDLVTTELLNLTWKRGIYDVKAGIYRIYADLTLKEEHANPAGFEAYIDIYAQQDIIAVEPQTDITVALNTPAADLPLPATVRVTYHDHTTGFLAVNWDRSAYLSNKGAEYDLKGALILKPLISNSKGLYAENKVIIRKNIVSVKPLANVTTPYNTAFEEVELPVKVMATFDDATTDTVGVEWQPGNYDKLQPGDYPLQGALIYDESIDNTQNITAAIILTVLPKPKNIVSIAVLDTAAVSYGTLLKDITVLKMAVQVTYDDGTTGNLQMDWDSEEYDPLDPQDYTFTGTPILINGVINKDELTAQLIIKLNNKAVINIENPPLISIKYGTLQDDAGLPETVNVTYNDQTKGTEGVVWSSATYNPALEGEYLFKGKLVLSDEVGNPDSLYAEMTVKVGPKPLTIVSIAAAEAAIPFGTDFTAAQLLFPKQVTVTYDNGTTGALTVNWAEGDYLGGEPGEFTLTGTVELIEGVINPDAITADLKITIGKHIISSFVNPSPLTQVFGTVAADLILPDEVNAVFADGANQDLNVNWDTSTFNGSLAGTYVIKGAFVLADDIENPKPVIPQIEITVLPRVKSITELKTDTLKVSYGKPFADLLLPVTALAKLDDRTEVSIPILAGSFKADGDEYDPAEAGQYVYNGTLVLPQDIQNPANILSRLIIIEGKKAIESLAQSDTLKVSFDTGYDALTLPDAIKVTYSDGTNEMLTVNWSPGNYDSKTPGTYVLQGALTVPDEIDNPKSLQPVITVVVAERIKTLVSITEQAITVAYGTLAQQLQLPPTRIGLFDDGTTALLTVKTWENDNFNPIIKGVYPFNGTVEMPANTQNPEQITALFNVSVESRYIIAVAVPEPVVVPFGTVYDNLPLPATVKVTYSDNSVDELPVNWLPGTYEGSVAGEYLLSGTIVPDAPEENKDNLGATIKVTVKELQLMIDSVIVTSPIHFPYGTTLGQVLTQLGSTLKVQYTNAAEGTADVAWESPLFNGNTPASYIFTGLIDPAENAANPKDLSARVEVIIDRKNIISVAEPTALIDVYGKQFSELALPSTVKVTYDDQTTEDLPVTWNEGDYLNNIFSQQAVKGEIELTDDVTNTLNLKAVVRVTLQKDILSVALIDPKTVTYGTLIKDLNLPTLVEVTYNDGTKESLPVVWDEAAYTAAPVGDLMLTGALTLAPNTFNTTAQTALIKLTIQKAKQTIIFTAITDKVYGDEPFKLIATASSGLPVSFELVDGNITITDDLAAISGTGEVIVKAVQAGNAFFDTAETTQSFKISKALLKVYGDTLTRLFGEENPAFTYHITGFKYADTETALRDNNSLQGNPILTTLATAVTEPGNYPVLVTPGDLTADNYEFSFENGLLTVKSMYHTLTWDTKGGTPLAAIQVKDQEKAPQQVTTKDGFVFYTWYSDVTMETVFNFDAPVTDDMTLYADWKITPLPASGPISMRTIADYMVVLGEVTTAERSAPFGMLMLNTKSHLLNKTAPFKLSDWYNYGQLKKAVITTIPATGGSMSSIMTGLNVINDGGAAITASGICWSTLANPTIAANKVNAALASGTASVAVTGLEIGVKYYLKAYATNSAGTVYGNQLILVIKEDGLIEILRK